MIKSLMPIAAIVVCTATLTGCGESNGSKEQASNKAQDQATEQYNKDIERQNTVRSQIQ